MNDMIESLSWALLLFVFVGLSFLRTAVENCASHEDDFNKMNKILGIFYWVALLILVCAFLLVVAGNAITTMNHLCLYGAALFSAVFLSLVTGGGPEAYSPTVAKYYGSGL